MAEVLEAIRAIAAPVGGGLFVAVLALYAFAERERMLKLERAWARFAAPRGHALSPHRGLAWFRPGVGQAPALRGSLGGTTFTIEPGGWRRWRDTTVSAPIAVSAPVAPGAEIPEDAMDAEACRLWGALRSERSGAQLRVWPARTREDPRREGHFVAVGWSLLEQDPAVLELAVALVCRLSQHPPERFGPGARHVPWFMRQ